MLKYSEILSFKHKRLILMARITGNLDAYCKLRYETILFSRVWNSRHGRREVGSACWYCPVHSWQRGCLWLKCIVGTVFCRMIGHSCIASKMSSYRQWILCFCKLTVEPSQICQITSPCLDTKDLGKKNTYSAVLYFYVVVILLYFLISACSTLVI